MVPPPPPPPPPPRAPLHPRLRSLLGRLILRRNRSPRLPQSGILRPRPRRHRPRRRRRTFNPVAANGFYDYFHILGQNLWSLTRPGLIKRPRIPPFYTYVLDFALEPA